MFKQNCRNGTIKVSNWIKQATRNYPQSLIHLPFWEQRILWKKHSHQFLHTTGKSIWSFIWIKSLQT